MAASQDLDKVMNLLLQQNSSASSFQDNSSLNGVLLQALLDGQGGRGQQQPAAAQAPQPQVQSILNQLNGNPKLSQQLSPSFPPQAAAGQQHQQQQQQQLDNLQLRQQIQTLQQQQARLEEQLRRQMQHQQQAQAPPAAATAQPETADQSIDSILKMLASQGQPAATPQQQPPAAANSNNNGDLNALLGQVKPEELIKFLPALLQNQGQATQAPAPVAMPQNPAQQQGKDPQLSRLLDALLKNQGQTAAGAPAGAPAPAGLTQQSLSFLPQDLLSHQSFAQAPAAAAATTNNNPTNNLNIMSLAALRQQQQQQQAMPVGRSRSPAPAVSSSETSSTGSSNSRGNNNASNSSPTAASHRDAAGVDSSYPLTDIEYPGQHDCMFGRGGGTSNHIGNINFRLLVEKYKKRYAEASKLEKPQVAELVVQQWRAQNPPGRFLTLTNPEEGSLSKWHDVGDKRARRKCAQALREKQGRCRDGSAEFSSPGIAVAETPAKRARLN